MGLQLSRREFERLVVEHLPSAGRFAIRLTGDPDVAEEIMQEALLRASRSWKTFGGRSGFSTWLVRIVINAFRDHLAKAGRHNETLREDLADTRAPDPPSQAAASEIGEIVARAVSSLPPRQREVLVLTAYERLSTSAVSELLGVSEQAVRTSLYHARQKLRGDLGRHLDGDQR